MDATERRRMASTEAAEWFVRLQEDDLPRAVREQYVDWLRDSPTHVAEMLRIAQVHGALEQFQRWASLSTAIPDREPDGESNVIPLAVDGVGREREAATRGRSVAWRFAFAASVAAVMVAATVFIQRARDQVIDTERGERREIVLSDGSVVQVDPKTLLRVRFTDRDRRVDLDRGRAVFHVAKSPGRPFTVQADGTTVRAIGTAFGVERATQGVVVTVSEGKVAVRALEDESVLAAGEQMLVERTGHTEPVRRVDTARELAWAEGRLIFHNDSISRIIDEFNRYNRVQLHVTDAALAGRRVSGVFSASDPESFIAFIQTVALVKVTRRGDGDITLSSHRAP